MKKSLVELKNIIQLWYSFRDTYICNYLIARMLYVMQNMLDFTKEVVGYLFGFDNGVMTMEGQRILSNSNDSKAIQDALKELDAKAANLKIKVVELSDGSEITLVK